MAVNYNTSSKICWLNSPDFSQLLQCQKNIYHLSKHLILVFIDLLTYLSYLYIIFEFFKYFKEVLIFVVSTNSTVQLITVT